MLKRLTASDNCALYRIDDPQHAPVDEIVVSTPESRRICNDPCTVGVEYTRLLRQACTRILRCVAEERLMLPHEHETIVFHVLRGGLNFGLREALADAFGWNAHGSAFISAQRARRNPNSEDWHITESDYRKVYIPKVATAVLGDVVATGTSLRHALHELLRAVAEQRAALKNILFFTIGGPRAAEIIHEIDALCRERFPEYEGSILVYLEGRFPVPGPDSPLSVKITGTDLVRRGAVMAPEFVESQYESPGYPLERCTIYDAGSRAFWIPEYAADVESYWRRVLNQAGKGLTFTDLLAERFPELDPGRFGPVDLAEVAGTRIDRIRALC